MATTTIGHLLLRRILPEGMRDNIPVLDKAGLNKTLQHIAENHPEQYRDVTKGMLDVGREAAISTGGYSFGLKALRRTLAAKHMQMSLGSELQKIYTNPNLSDGDRDHAILKAASVWQGKLPDAVLKEAHGLQNPIAMQVVSGARGNKMNLNSLLGADLIYVDNKNQPIPIPVLRNYAQGLQPAEYFAGSFGARKGILDTKQATADAGFFSKQLTQATHRLVVTAHDDEDPYDHSQPRGMVTSTSDNDNEGALLAHPIGGYDRNTELTPKILKDLRNRGIDQLLVRSPIVGGPEDGGVYARDVGRRERGQVAPIGDYVGIAAANALAEPLTQSQLCLAEGTAVRMANGSIKNIENIVVGDWVLGAWQEQSLYSDMIRVEKGPVEVTAVFNNGPKPCYTYTFAGGYQSTDEKEAHLSDELDITVQCTTDHKILACHKHVDVEYSSRLYELIPISTGEAHWDDEDFYFYAWAFSPSEDISPIRVLIEVSDPEVVATYDIEVDHSDHMFVLANGLIVSNSSKHSGGVAGATAGAVAGFGAINNMIQAPKIFPGGAVHAQVDGRVQTVEDAPQGGQYVTIEGTRHYVPPGRPVTVARGHIVEAGDTITEGMPQPAETVQHKGIGEGKRYFVESFQNVLRNSGINAHRRNIELLARGLINHVRLTDEVGDMAPDDVVPYQTLERQWVPRAGHVVVAPKQALGKYLEKPILHYSIGTKIRPSMLPKLEQFGVDRLHVHPDPPPFEPEMIRGMEVGSKDPDPFTRQLSSYQSKSVLEGARRGAVSDETGTSYVPALARGENFGLKGLTKGFQTDQEKP